MPRRYFNKYLSFCWQEKLILVTSFFFSSHNFKVSAAGKFVILLSKRFLIITPGYHLELSVFVNSGLKTKWILSCEAGVGSETPSWLPCFCSKLVDAKTKQEALKKKKKSVSLFMLFSGNHQSWPGTKKNKLLFFSFFLCRELSTEG